MDDDIMTSKPWQALAEVLKRGAAQPDSERFDPEELAAVMRGCLAIAALTARMAGPVVAFMQAGRKMSADRLAELTNALRRLLDEDAIGADRPILASIKDHGGTFATVAEKVFEAETAIQASLIRMLHPETM